MNQTHSASTGQEARQMIRRGVHNQHTANLAPGYLQANLVIVPQESAEEFAQFCRANPKPCPLLEQLPPGEWEATLLAPGSDLRTDLPGYVLWEEGDPIATTTDISHLWREDLVSFLIGCSFTFDNLLSSHGFSVRHRDLGRNVPMYRTRVPCQPSGRFQGNMVVSMRPFSPDRIEAVRQWSGRLPLAHGEPVHWGDPAHLGIRDLDSPDFGEAVPIEPGEIPVFWACGVTPQLALEKARLSFAITHKPGHMFISDWRDEQLLDRMQLQS